MTIITEKKDPLGYLSKKITTIRHFLNLAPRQDGNNLKDRTDFGMTYTEKEKTSAFVKSDYLKNIIVLHAQAFKTYSSNRNLKYNFYYMIFQTSTTQDLARLYQIKLNIDNRIFRLFESS